MQKKEHHMKVGVNLINFGPGVSPDALVRWAQLVETLGYHLRGQPPLGSLSPSYVQQPSMTPTNF
jgi:hypothetical protein